MSSIHAVDTLLAGAVAGQDVPGVAAAATTDEATIYEGGFGKMALGQDAPMTPDTVVWIASMTKAVTAVAAMQLVERGELDLDAPAGAWAPYLDRVKVLEGFDAQDQPILRPPTVPVTLRHLLTHAAGFGYDIWDEKTNKFMDVAKRPGVISGKMTALELPLTFDPGTEWQYGISIDWVGKMVEAMTGKRLGDYFATEIFAPLGMQDTGFALTSDMRNRLAKVHQRGSDDGFEVLDFEMPQNPEFEMGGGGLYSTVRDYLKFVKMILNQGRANGQAILQPETVRMMSVNQMGPCRVRTLVSSAPDRSNDADFFPGMSKTWGLSFMINTATAPTGRSPGSLAWAGLANTYFWIDPVKGIGGVFATQILPFVDEKALPLYYAFEKSVYDNLA